MNFKLIFRTTLFLAFSTVAFAAPRFVSLSNSHVIYTNFEAGAVDKPTLVLLNGLDSDTTTWNQYVAELKKDPQNAPSILRLDFMGQGKTLVRNGSVTTDIHYKDQVADLAETLSILKIKGPINLLGHSYGGGIATAFAAEYPSFIKNLVIVAPYTEFHRKGDELLKLQVAWTRMLYPLNPFSNAEIYDFFLKFLVFEIFPLQGVPRSKSKSIYHMIRGVKELKLSQVVNRLPSNTLYLISATADRLVEKDILAKFWDIVPDRVKQFHIHIDSGHRVTTEAPALLAKITHDVILAPTPAQNCAPLLK